MKNYAGWWFGSFFIFPYIGKNSSQLTNIFFRGVGIPPTSMFSMYLYDVWRWSPTTRHPSLVGDTPNAVSGMQPFCHYVGPPFEKFTMEPMGQRGSPYCSKIFIQSRENRLSCHKSSFLFAGLPSRSLFFYMDMLDVVGSYFVGKPW